MDLGATSSFVTEPSDSDTMSRPPQSASAPFLSPSLLLTILTSALSLLVPALSAFAYALHHSPATAQSATFLACLLSHVLVAFNLRTRKQPLSRKPLFSNPAMLVWLSAAVALAAASAGSASVRSHLKLVVLDAAQWTFVAVVSVCGTFWVEVVKILAATRVCVVAGDAERREERVSLLSGAL